MIETQGTLGWCSCVTQGPWCGLAIAIAIAGGITVHPLKD
jgi:hypothetical protein